MGQENGTRAARGDVASPREGGDAEPRRAVGVAADPAVDVRAKRRRFTAQYKREILREADGLRESGQIGALLRREGLYASHLATWRRQRDAGELAGLEPRRRGRKPDPATQVARLEAENARLQRRLTMADAILDAQKKLAAILEAQDSDDTGTTPS